MIIILNKFSNNLLCLLVICFAVVCNNSYSQKITNDVSVQIKYVNASENFLIAYATMTYDSIVLYQKQFVIFDANDSCVEDSILLFSTMESDTILKYMELAKKMFKDTVRYDRETDRLIRPPYVTAVLTQNNVYKEKKWQFSDNTDLPSSFCEFFNYIEILIRKHRKKGIRHISI